MGSVIPCSRTEGLKEREFHVINTDLLSSSLLRSRTVASYIGRPSCPQRGAVGTDDSDPLRRQQGFAATPYPSPPAEKRDSTRLSRPPRSRHNRLKRETFLTHVKSPVPSPELGTSCTTSFRPRTSSPPPSLCSSRSKRLQGSARGTSSAAASGRRSSDSAKVEGEVGVVLPAACGSSTLAGTETRSRQFLGILPSVKADLESGTQSARAQP